MALGQNKYIFLGHDVVMEHEQSVYCREIAADVSNASLEMHLQQPSASAPSQLCREITHFLTLPHRQHRCALPKPTGYAQHDASSISSWRSFDMTRRPVFHSVRLVYGPQRSEVSEWKW